jgi:hypothetical protein
MGLHGSARVYTLSPHSCNTHALGPKHKVVHTIQLHYFHTHPSGYSGLYLCPMDRLTDLFNGLTPEQRAEINSSHQRINDIGKSNLRAMPPDPLTNSQLHTKLSGLDTSALDPSALHDLFRGSVMEDSKPRFPPPKVLPCANVEVGKYRVCPNPGKMACSSCKLVSYCSKVGISLH